MRIHTYIESSDVSGFSFNEDMNFDEVYTINIRNVF